MNPEQTWAVLAAGSAVTLVLLVACALLWRSTRRLGARLTELESATTLEPMGTSNAADAPQRGDTATYVITGIDVEQTPATVPARIDGALFADIVARESVVKAAGLAAGLRRALAPETRNRIRFEMKREVKRSRKQRKVDLKSALRDLQARERAAMGQEPNAGDAA